MKNSKLIYGIQQVGIGVTDAEEAFRWYAQVLGADLLIFDDRKTATHMARYMGGEAHQKRALLAMNGNGGSGYEIWQYQDRTPAAPMEDIHLGDTGVNYISIKSHNLKEARTRLEQAGVECLEWSSVTDTEQEAFFFHDPYGNLIQLLPSDDWFSRKYGAFGGICGVGIGVSDIEKSKRLYADILGYNTVVHDEVVPAPDHAGKLRQVRLARATPATGGFSPLLGSSTLTLLQALDREPRKVFADRYWGDLGYIHVCFDTKHIGALMDECEEKGYPFQVKSEETFEMGDTNGRWGYLEDDDGTLIEFVEAQRVPLVKKLNLSIDMRKRDPHQPLPNWLLKALRLKRKRF